MGKYIEDSMKAGVLLSTEGCLPSALGARVRRSEGNFKVVDGPFQDFNGTVEEVRPEKGKVRVLISIFGRATPVELDFVQVEKS